MIFTNDRLKLVEHLKRSIKKMVLILKWSTLLFAIVKLLFAFKNNDFSILSTKDLGKFILFNENPFGFHLWYIGAYLYVLIIILYLEKCNKLSYIYWSIPILLLLDFLVNIVWFYGIKSFLFIMYVILHVLDFPISR